MMKLLVDVNEGFPITNSLMPIGALPVMLKATAFDEAFKPAFSSVTLEKSTPLKFQVLVVAGLNSDTLKELREDENALELIPRTCMPSASDMTCIPPRPSEESVPWETSPPTAGAAIRQTTATASNFFIVHSPMLNV